MSDRIVHVLCDPQDALEVRRLWGRYDWPGLNGRVYFDVDPERFADVQDEAAILRRVRVRTLRDSTVTLVAIGRCAHSLRSIDWVIKASLFHERGQAPNGLVMVYLPGVNPAGDLSPRMLANVRRGAEGYAALCKSPLDNQAIEEAYVARVGRLSAIQNAEPLMRTNAVCRSCGVVHDR